MLKAKKHTANTMESHSIPLKTLNAVTHINSLITCCKHVPSPKAEPNKNLLPQSNFFSSFWF